MTQRFSGAALLLPMALASLFAGQASAQTADVPAAQPATIRTDPTDFFTGFWRRPNMLGDMGGLRNLLGSYGMTLSLTETSEVLGNVTGGLKQGATYDGLTTLTLQLDTQKAFGWEGGLFNISGLQIHGRNLSEFYLSNLQTASGIEAQPTTRLWEIWYQQTMLDGKLDVKLGQQSIDQEFITSQGSALFLNTMMGWPMLPSANLYAGGPAYPLSSLGVRLRAQPWRNVTVLAGVFQDNPPGGPFADDSQLRGTTRWGGNFNLRTGALFIAEVQYALNQPAAGDMDDGTRHYGLLGTYKLGVWYDTAAFPSQSIDSTGLSLADPNSTGNPRLLRNNFSIYAVADQMVWRPAEDSPQAVGVFARLMGGPGDRNLINFSVNAGVTLKAPLPGRDDDTFGVGFGVARVSNGARMFDQDTNAFGGGPIPVRSSETFIEVTYQAQVTPWLQIQPDFQYVFTPGGGLADPNRPGKRIGNEAILGVRANVTF
jgi:porin